MTKEELQARIQELEMELAYKEYNVVQWETLATKHNCSSPKELQDYIEQLIFYAQ